MSESNTNNSISQSVSSQYPSSLSDKNTLNNKTFDSVTQSLSQITTSVFSISQPSSTNTSFEKHAENLVRFEMKSPLSVWPAVYPSV